MIGYVPVLVAAAGFAADRRRKVSLYSETIAEALGVDAHEASVVEMVIRGEYHPTLDHLTRAQLVRAARRAKAGLDEARRSDPDVARFYEAQAR